ncbi:hypothetical protein JFT44_22160 [Pseudomonas sp. MF5691]|uniref:hypothetical protein n=1 Tax=Pseudomonas sp. MF5691 TaxID=2797526 RepID=UPI0018E83EC4|nr:hypothetical protein [Pseudomonas sp. MF5691]MBJ2292625.1 hypothetical protein [Pseudomonas sp. MF5691]
MISILHNEVERLRPAQEELAAQVAEFVAAGGRIEEGPASGYIPKPITYSNQMPPAPKPLMRRRAEPAQLAQDSVDMRTQQRLKLAEKVRELAADNPKCEVANILNIDRRTVSKIGNDFNITFKTPTRGGSLNLEPKKVDDDRDARLAERIRAFLELGISRRKCCGKLAIASKAFERIIAKHGIDYPKLVRRASVCAA